MKKVKNFNSFISEEREYDFSHPDSPDSWKVIIPDDQPQVYDKVICTSNTNNEDKLTIGKEYQIFGLSSMGDKYFISADDNRYDHYPIKCFSKEKVMEAKVPTYAPRPKVSQNPEIIESIEEYSQNMGRRNQTHEGYKVTTNKRTIKFLILAEQDCCEAWGYFTSEDNLKEFIGAQLINVEVVDTAMNVVELKLDDIDKEERGDNEDRSTNTMFVNFQTSVELLQFVAYNNHNGWYGHNAYFIIDDNIEKETKL